MSIEQFPIKTIVKAPEDAHKKNELDLNGISKELLTNTVEMMRITPDDTELWHSYGQLRAKVYIDQRKFLPESAKNELGEEFDEDDDRSTHVVAVRDGQVIGSTRLIHRPHNNPLPAEKYFDLDLTGPQLEVSRLIVDKESAGPYHKLAAIGLLRSVMREANRHEITYVHAIMERHLKRYLEAIGMVLEPVSEERYVEDYHSKNVAIRINAEETIQHIAEADKKRDEKIAPFFRLQAVQHGLGKISLSDFAPNPRRFERNLGFLSKKEQLALQDSKVAIAGTGGDGGQLAITLAQMGVSHFRLADPEQFEVENLNRQAGASYHTIGRNKAEVIGEEIHKINPWATIEIYPHGVNDENIEEFVADTNLVFDETEYTQPELGAMIARAARKVDIPVMMALNVGYGSRILTFDPSGESFESWLGLSEDAPLEEIAKADVPLERWLGRLPKYANTNLFEKVQKEEMSAPSVAPGVLLAAGVAATQAQNLLLSDITPSRLKNVVFAPKMISIDAMDGSASTINSKSRTGFYVSALRALSRTRRGLNPPYDL